MGAILGGAQSHVVLNRRHLRSGKKSEALKTIGKKKKKYDIAFNVKLDKSSEHEALSTI